MQTHSLSLHHLARPAEGAGPAPLAILLHGYGSNEEDLFGLAPYLDRRLLILSVRAPLVLMPGAFAWFEIGFTPQGIEVDERQAERSLRALVSFVEEAVAAYEADPARVLLVGFSQGATMAALAALTRPDLAAGAAVLSGIVPSQLLGEPPDAERLRGRAFFVAHGTHDQVVPIANGRASRALLERLPVALTYREYPMGHEINAACLGDLAAWLSDRLT